MNEQEESPEKELTKRESGNLLHIEFRKQKILRMHKDHSKNFNLMKMCIETMRNNQSEMRNTFFEMKTTLEEINNNRLNYSID